MTASRIVSSPYHRVEIDGRSFPFTTFEQVSRAYQRTIDQLGLGCRETPLCSIFDSAGVQTAYISYNGKGWAGSQRDWVSSNEPLYNPYEA
jgi:hypothetical protein